RLRRGPDGSGPAGEGDAAPQPDRTAGDPAEDHLGARPAADGVGAGALVVALGDRRAQAGRAPGVDRSGGSCGAVNSSRPAAPAVASAASGAGAPPAGGTPRAAAPRARRREAEGRPGRDSREDSSPW